MTTDREVIVNGVKFTREEAHGLRPRRRWFRQGPDFGRSVRASTTGGLETEAMLDRIEELETEVKRMRSLAHDAIEYISPYLGIDETEDERAKAYEALEAVVNDARL